MLSIVGVGAVGREGLLGTLGTVREPGEGVSGTGMYLVLEGGVMGAGMGMDFRGRGRIREFVMRGW